jgi:hypothetical protein
VDPLPYEVANPEGEESQVADPEHFQQQIVLPPFFTLLRAPRNLDGTIFDEEPISSGSERGSLVPVMIPKSVLSSST